MIILDYKDRRPLYEQIVDKFSDMILKGVLKPDEKLPSVRSLAMELSINPNTIQRAYMELEHRGFLYSVKGRGNFVSDNDQLKEERRREIWNQLTDNLKEACVHGILEKEIIELIRSIYDGKSQQAEKSIDGKSQQTEDMIKGKSQQTEDIIDKNQITNQVMEGGIVHD